MIKKSQHKKVSTAGHETAHTQPKRDESRKTQERAFGTRLVSVEEVNKLKDQIVKKMDELNQKKSDRALLVILEWIRK